MATTGSTPDGVDACREHAGESILRLTAGELADPFVYGDEGRMATIGRGAAVMQLQGKTMYGKTAWLAVGGVHLALLSTGEDIAKTVANWPWAGFTHERPARISVRTQEAAS